MKTVFVDLKVTIKQIKWNYEGHKSHRMLFFYIIHFHEILFFILFFGLNKETALNNFSPWNKGGGTGSHNRLWNANKKSTKQSLQYVQLDISNMAATE